MAKASDDPMVSSTQQQPLPYPLITTLTQGLQIVRIVIISPYNIVVRRDKSRILRQDNARIFPHPRLHEKISLVEVGCLRAFTHAGEIVVEDSQYTLATIGRII